MRICNFVSHPTANGIIGTLAVPGDKSISHRAIIFSAIAHGMSVINGFLDGEDCLATIRVFQNMGVTIEGPLDQQVIVYGVGKYGLQSPKNILDCGNSGTTMRLMAGLLSAQKFDTQLSGDESLSRRPMLRVSKPLTAMGAKISTTEGKPPLYIEGNSTLSGINYLMPEASAQVKSSLLLAGLYAQGETRITETGTSRNHTELMLASFGYPILVDQKTIIINSNHELLATEIEVPGDISSAAFFIVAATITPGSNLTIRNVGINPTRLGIVHLLLEMGASISIMNQRQYGAEPVADLHIEYAPLKGIEIPPEWVPLTIDEFPILLIAAAAAEGETIVREARELRHKESDRIAAMISGLKELGIRCTEFEDGAAITGGIFQGGVVDSRGDHRIAMAFTVAGAIAQSPIKIKNCANISTSYPSFLATTKHLQLNVEEFFEHV
ncbi:MAG: 3-phosphoshikimate 1-carboxyvinyltransferase [Legionella sp. 40-6]|nr:3-phosphoshikimate 1-carboxyvinyltransferase [Legionella sp.]OJY29317.1 MAG: 3-phosphoshikimate 1-carboxyvinyltransferase [Legionella sp. 40-6]